MTSKKLDQFLCDFIPSGSMIEIDAVWLQRALIEYEQNKKMMLLQLKEYKRIVERLSFKNELLKVKNELKEIENNVIYRVDVRA